MTNSKKKLSVIGAEKAKISLASLLSNAPPRREEAIAGALIRSRTALPAMAPSNMPLACWPKYKQNSRVEPKAMILSLQSMSA